MGPTRTYQLLGTTMAPSMMSCGTVSSFAGSLLPHAEDPAACAFWFALDSSIYNSLLMMNSILIGPRQLGHRFFSFEAGNQLLQFGHQWKSRPHQGSLPIQTCRHASLGVPSLGFRLRLALSMTYDIKALWMSPSVFAQTCQLQFMICTYMSQPHYRSLHASDTSMWALLASFPRRLNFCAMLVRAICHKHD